MPTPRRRLQSSSDPRQERTIVTPPSSTPSTAEDSCTERIVIPTFNAEFVPETDGGPCLKRPVLRLTINHDGSSCGCDGTCQIPEPGCGPPGRWTEVRLLCADHTYEYRADGSLDAQTPAVAVEDLT